MNITDKLLNKFAVLEDLLNDVSKCSSSSRTTIIAMALSTISEIKSTISSVKKEILMSSDEVKRIMAKYNFYDLPEVKGEQVDLMISLPQPRFGNSTDKIIQTKSKSTKSKSKKAK